AQSDDDRRRHLRLHQRQHHDRDAGLERPAPPHSGRAAAPFARPAVHRADGTSAARRPVMAERKAEAEGRGGLKDGNGKVRLGSGAFAGPYSFRSRFENGGETNPEELIGAAHAGCFSMALAFGLEKAGHKATRIRTTAKVRLEASDGGFAITAIALETEAEVP